MLFLFGDVKFCSSFEYRGMRNVVRFRNCRY